MSIFLSYNPYCIFIIQLMQLIWDVGVVNGWRYLGKMVLMLEA